MENKRLVGLLMLIGGVALLLVSATADMTGLGGNPNIFGYRQVAGVIIGLLAALVGGWLYRQAPPEKR